MINEQIKNYYNVENLEFFNADCMHLMKNFKDKEFDLAIVDPPYGIGADKAQNSTASQREKANGKSKAGRGWKAYKETDWDNETPSAEYWRELRRVSKNQIVWGGNYFTDHLEPKMGWIVWNKMQRDFSLADGELAWTSFDKAMRIFDMSRGEALAKNNKTGGRFHPTQKPVKLYEWILQNYASEGDFILDTHLGSGSIALAVDKANTIDNKNFTFVGIELDSDYFNASIQRFKNYKNQLTIF